jgi:dTMP kinase
VVIADRFLLANIVYQGYAGGLDVERVRRVGEVATGGITPSLTFLLDMSVEVAAARLDRNLDRMESRGQQFLQRVRDGFLTEAARFPERILVVDAARDVQTIQTEIQAAAQESGLLT